MRIHVFSSAVVAAAMLALSLPAQAGSLTRSFVSSTGVDSNPCTIAQPCATFNAAYNAVAANGIIAALDPGKYSPLTITMPVTINGNGWAAITAPLNGNGITINIAGGTGNVILNGIEVDGAGQAYNGILFQSGSSLTITDCIIKDFVESASNSQNGQSGFGISIQPANGTTVDFQISNTTLLNNKYAGIAYFPLSGSATAYGAIDHVVATNNGGGIMVDMATASGGTANVSVSNSVLSNSVNSGSGFLGLPGAGTITATLDSDEINNNYNGIDISGSITVVLSRSVITNNTQYGIQNQGTIDTYADNRYDGNGSGNAIGTNPTLTTATAQ